MHLRKKLLLLIAANFAVTFVNSKEVDYCDVPSCKPRKHVMCEFKGKAQCEAGHVQSPLTPKQKTDLLDWHNKVRSGVARSTSKLVPGGGFDQPVSNMLEMRWSEELERFAQRWADQCDVAVQRKHDQCRNTLHKKDEAGQLVYIYTYSSESDGMDLALDKMKEEWTQGPLAMPDGNETLSGPRESILQVTWPSAKTVGCGATHFDNGEQHTAIIVCDYGAAIGPRGGPRYGSTCTNCPPPRVCSITWPGLCLSPRPSDGPALGPAILTMASGLYVAGTLRRGD